MCSGINYSVNKSQKTLNKDDDEDKEDEIDVLNCLDERSLGGCERDKKNSEFCKPHSRINSCFKNESSLSAFDSKTAFDNVLLLKENVRHAADNLNKFSVKTKFRKDENYEEIEREEYETSQSRINNLISKDEFNALIHDTNTKCFDEEQIISDSEDDGASANEQEFSSMHSISRILHIAGNQFNEQEQGHSCTQNPNAFQSWIGSMVQSKDCEISLCTDEGRGCDSDREANVSPEQKDSDDEVYVPVNKNGYSKLSANSSNEEDEDSDCGREFDRAGQKQRFNIFVHERNTEQFDEVSSINSDDDYGEGGKFPDVSPINRSSIDSGHNFRCTPMELQEGSLRVKSTTCLNAESNLNSHDVPSHRLDTDSNSKHYAGTRWSDENVKSLWSPDKCNPSLTYRREFGNYSRNLLMSSCVRDDDSTLKRNCLELSTTKVTNGDRSQLMTRPWKSDNFKQSHDSDDSSKLCTETLDEDNRKRTDDVKQEIQEIEWQLNKSSSALSNPNLFCMPRYHLMDGYGNREDYEQSTRNSTAERLMQMQMRRDARKGRKDAGVTKASEIPGNKGDKNIEELIDFINSSSKKETDVIHHPTSNSEKIGRKGKKKSGMSFSHHERTLTDKKSKDNSKSVSALNPVASSKSPANSDHSSDVSGRLIDVVTALITDENLNKIDCITGIIPADDALHTEIVDTAIVIENVCATKSDKNSGSGISQDDFSAADSSNDDVAEDRIKTVDQFVEMTSSSDLKNSDVDSIMSQDFLMDDEEIPAFDEDFKVVQNRKKSKKPSLKKSNSNAFSLEDLYHSKPSTSYVLPNGFGRTKTNDSHSARYVDWHCARDNAQHNNDTSSLSSVSSATNSLKESDVALLRHNVNVKSSSNERSRNFAKNSTELSSFGDAFSAVAAVDVSSIDSQSVCTSVADSAEAADQQHHQLELEDNAISMECVTSKPNFAKAVTVRSANPSTKRSTKSVVFLDTRNNSDKICVEKDLGFTFGFLDEYQPQVRNDALSSSSCFKGQRSILQTTLNNDDSAKATEDAMKQDLSRSIEESNINAPLQTTLNPETIKSSMIVYPNGCLLPASSAYYTMTMTCNGPVLCISQPPLIPLLPFVGPHVEPHNPVDVVTPNVPSYICESTPSSAVALTQWQSSAYACIDSCVSPSQSPTYVRMNAEVPTECSTPLTDVAVTSRFNLRGAQQFLHDAFQKVLFNEAQDANPSVIRFSAD